MMCKLPTACTNMSFQHVGLLHMNVPVFSLWRLKQDFSWTGKQDFV